LLNGPVLYRVLATQALHLAQPLCSAVFVVMKDM
jgi:hypothetical protein